MSDSDKPQEVKLEIQLDDETAQGTYSNLAVINHSDAEFTLDFIFVQPQAPRAKVRSRVITSPKHFKRLLMVLADNLEKYEKQFGKVEVGTGDEGPQAGNYH